MHGHLNVIIFNTMHVYTYHSYTHEVFPLLVYKMSP